jgi:hypothetical protein
MPRDLGDLAESVSSAVSAFPAAERRGVQRASWRVRDSARSEIRRATGDMRLSGVGYRGAKVGARAQMKRTKAARAEVSATGPLHLIERDTEPHIIPRVRGKRARKRYVKVDGKIKAWASHPGTSGQYPFAKGVKKAAPEVPKIVRAEIGRAIVAAWK